MMHLLSTIYVQIETDHHYSVQNEDYLTKITIADAQRKHSGTYHIHAKNESGSDEAEVDFIILGEKNINYANNLNEFQQILSYQR